MSKINQKRTNLGLTPLTIIVVPGANYYQHDLDGNLIQDDTWDYYWDGENRLIRMIARIPQQNAPNDPLQLDFEYDYLGRRIKKSVLWQNSTTTVRKFVYDGWKLIAELDSNNNVIRTYAWGLDISGTLDGAAGIGGLLWSAEEGGDNVVYYTYDTRGNVTSVLAYNGTIMAEYEYGPFGEPLRATGPLAEANPFRFSTKYHDDETGLIYYGYRYYNPKTGRWISRDLIGEDGGLNLYGFVENNPINSIDIYGLRPIDFAFNAFINGQRGVWLDEPGTAFRQFKTDLRNFGQFDKNVANARLFSYGSIESKRIGGAQAGGANGASDTDYSHRRKRILGISFIGQTGFAWGPQSSRKAPIKNIRSSIQDLDNCTSIVTFNPSAGYPFTPSSVTPSIDYTISFIFKVTGDSQVTVRMVGNHNRFPDYEGYIDKNLVYQYSSPSAGPGILNLNRSLRATASLIVDNIEVPEDCKCLRGGQNPMR